jgi:hypothetical protein
MAYDVRCNGIVTICDGSEAWVRLQAKQHLLFCGLCERHNSEQVLEFIRESVVMYAR